METFQIQVTSDEPVDSAEALWKAGVPTIGPTFAKFTAAPGAWSVGGDMTAFVEADSEQAAGRRVRELVGRKPDVVAHRPVGTGYDPAAEF